MADYSFDKTLRLLESGDYQSVFDNTRIKVSTQHVLFLATDNKRAVPRLGLVIAKKNIRLATQRNRIKRIIRESFRLNQHSLVGLDTIVLARRGLDQLDNQSLHKMFNQLWQKLQRKANQ